MINFIKKKYFRFFASRNLLKINFIIYKYFKEKNIGTLDLDFSDKPSRAKIVQNIIDEKNYKNYLEIGCWKPKVHEDYLGVHPLFSTHKKMTNMKKKQPKRKTFF